MPICGSPFQTLIGTVGTFLCTLARWSVPEFQTLIGTVGTSARRKNLKLISFRVSNPYRYGRNPEPKRPRRRRVRMFQTLIGTVGTMSNFTGGRPVVRVSNPYRYGRNPSKYYGDLNRWSWVSNPYRYGRNVDHDGGHVLALVFQTLIGTVGTRASLCGCARAPVSNPYRYGRNPAPR